MEQHEEEVPGVFQGASEYDSGFRGHTSRVRPGFGKTDDNKSP
jgi:hypothetical protein